MSKENRRFDRAYMPRLSSSDPTGSSIWGLTDESAASRNEHDEGRNNTAEVCDRKGSANRTASSAKSLTTDDVFESALAFRPESITDLPELPELSTLGHELGPRRNMYQLEYCTLFAQMHQTTGGRSGTPDGSSLSQLSDSSTSQPMDLPEFISGKPFASFVSSGGENALISSANQPNFLHSSESSVNLAQQATSASRGAIPKGNWPATEVIDTSTSGANFSTSLNLVFQDDSKPNLEKFSLRDDDLRSWEQPTHFASSCDYLEFIKHNGPTLKKLESTPKNEIAFVREYENYSRDAKGCHYLSPLDNPENTPTDPTPRQKSQISSQLTLISPEQSLRSDNGNTNSMSFQSSSKDSDLEQTLSCAYSTEASDCEREVQQQEQSWRPPSMSSSFERLWQLRDKAREAESRLSEGDDDDDNKSRQHDHPDDDDSSSAEESVCVNSRRWDLSSERRELHDNESRNLSRRRRQLCVGAGQHYDQQGDDHNSVSSWSAASRQSNVSGESPAFLKIMSNLHPTVPSKTSSTCPKLAFKAFSIEKPTSELSSKSVQVQRAAGGQDTPLTVDRGQCTSDDVSVDGISTTTRSDRNSMACLSTNDDVEVLSDNRKSKGGLLQSNVEQQAPVKILYPAPTQKTNRNFQSSKSSVCDKLSTLVSKATMCEDKADYKYSDTVDSNSEDVVAEKQTADHMGPNFDPKVKADESTLALDDDSSNLSLYTFLKKELSAQLKGTTTLKKRRGTVFADNELAARDSSKCASLDMVSSTATGFQTPMDEMKSTVTSQSVSTPYTESSVHQRFSVKPQELAAAAKALLNEINGRHGNDTSSQLSDSYDDDESSDLEMSLENPVLWRFERQQKRLFDKMSRCMLTELEMLSGICQLTPNIDKMSEEQVTVDQYPIVDTRIIFYLMRLFHARFTEDTYHMLAYMLEGYYAADMLLKHGIPDAVTGKSTVDGAYDCDGDSDSDGRAAVIFERIAAAGTLLVSSSSNFGSGTTSSGTASGGAYATGHRAKRGYVSVEAIINIPTHILRYLDNKLLAYIKKQEDKNRRARKVQMPVNELLCYYIINGYYKALQYRYELGNDKKKVAFAVSAFEAYIMERDAGSDRICFENLYTWIRTNEDRVIPIDRKCRNDVCLDSLKRLKSDQIVRLMNFKIYHQFEESKTVPEPDDLTLSAQRRLKKRQHRKDLTGLRVKSEASHACPVTDCQASIGCKTYMAHFITMHTTLHEELWHQDRAVHFVHPSLYPGSMRVYCISMLGLRYDGFTERLTIHLPSLSTDLPPGCEDYAHLLPVSLMYCQADKHCHTTTSRKHDNKSTLYIFWLMAPNISLPNVDVKKFHCNLTSYDLSIAGGTTKRLRVLEHSEFNGILPLLFDNYDNCFLIDFQQMSSLTKNFSSIFCLDLSFLSNAD